MSRRKISLKEGEVYGRLTILYEKREPRKSGGYTWFAYYICECGNQGKASIYDINSGHTGSCGCLNREAIISANRTRDEGYDYRHPLIKIWRSMISRCENESDNAYTNYGARGIDVCDEWRDNFKSFAVWAEENGWKEDSGLTIDRVDNDDGYSPENCRWVDSLIQNHNRRINKSNKTGISGVSYSENSVKKWRARMMYDGELILDENFHTKEEAIKARIKAEKYVDRKIEERLN